VTDDTIESTISNMSADVPTETRREYAAALVKNGILTEESANRQLTARGDAPLASRSTDVLLVQRDRLLADREFGRRYLDGDPEAVRQLTIVDMELAARGNTKLLDAPPKAADYGFNSAGRLPGVSPDAVA